MSNNEVKKAIKAVAGVTKVSVRWSRAMSVNCVSVVANYRNREEYLTILNQVKPLLSRDQFLMGITSNS